jgi:hypothetical protein
LHNTAEGVQNGLRSEVFRRDKIDEMFLSSLLLLAFQQRKMVILAGHEVEPFVEYPILLDRPLQDLPTVATRDLVLAPGKEEYQDGSHFMLAICIC